MGLVSAIKGWFGRGDTHDAMAASMSFGGGNSVYEGASQSYRMAGKGLYSGGPNSAASGNLRILRARSRHAVRNNPYGTSAIETHVTNLIGNGIKAKWKDPELQKLWDSWVKTCDADGDESFHGLQVLAARGQFEAGEALVRFHTRSNVSGVPLKLQVIEADHLDEAYSEVRTKQHWIRMGVEFNDRGQRTRYHLWRNHPSDHILSKGNTRLAIPADEILHVFRKLRAGQIRGIPELSPVLVRLYEIDEMQDATLVRQKTAALFGWIIRKRDVGEPYQPGVPAGTMGANGKTVKSQKKMPKITKIMPGGTHYLREDEDISFSQPADIAGIYVEYLKSELRAVAKGMGITYEQLTGDLEGVNYSSIRAGLIEFRRRIEFLQLTLMVFKFCEPVADKWLRRAVMFGVTPAEITLENYRDYLPEWRPPRWEWVDPLKDVQADLLEVRAGFATLASKQLERGSDPDTTVEQLEREQDLDITLDSNPAKVQKSGQIQQEKHEDKSQLQE